jgi:restriction endonuclease Mrr
VPVPDFQSLMLPVLTAASNGEISASNLRDRVYTNLKLTADNLSEMLPSGRQTTFANRIAWANLFLQRAGLIEKSSRGVYRATPMGIQILDEKPSKIDMTFLERFPSYVKWRRRSAAPRLVKLDSKATPPNKPKRPKLLKSSSDEAIKRSPKHLRPTYLIVCEKCPQFFRAPRDRSARGTWIRGRSAGKRKGDWRAGRRRY